METRQHMRASHSVSCRSKGAGGLLQRAGGSHRTQKRSLRRPPTGCHLAGRWGSNCQLGESKMQQIWVSTAVPETAAALSGGCCMITRPWHAHKRSPDQPQGHACGAVHGASLTGKRDVEAGAFDSGYAHGVRQPTDAVHAQEVGALLRSRRARPEEGREQAERRTQEGQQHAGMPDAAWAAGTGAWDSPGQQPTPAGSCRTELLRRGRAAAGCPAPPADPGAARQRGGRGAGDSRQS